MNYLDVKGKVIFITGVSRGIGKATAIGLRDSGAIVYGTGTNEENLAWTEAEENITGRVLDVRDQKGTEKWMNEICKKHRRSGIDVLINNAGIVDNAPMNLQDAARNEEVMSINYNGTFLTSQAYYKIQRKKGGNIINVASILGTVGVENSSTYCASKGAVVQLTRCMALEWASHKFRVNALCPGLVDTDFIKLITETPAILEGALSTIPMKRISQPSEMVGAMIFLASNASSYMTGQTLIIDGGTTCQ